MPRQTPQMCTMDGTKQFICQNNLHSSHQLLPYKGRDEEQSILLPPSQHLPSHPTVSQPPVPFTARKKDADPHRITAALGGKSLLLSCPQPCNKAKEEAIIPGHLSARHNAATALLGAQCYHCPPSMHVAWILEIIKILQGCSSSWKMGLRWVKERDGPFGVGRDPCGMLHPRGGGNQDGEGCRRDGET